MPNYGGSNAQLQLLHLSDSGHLRVGVRTGYGDTSPFLESSEDLSWAERTVYTGD